MKPHLTESRAWAGMKELIHKWDELPGMFKPDGDMAPAVFASTIIASVFANRLDMEYPFHGESLKWK